jgi:AraC-like DNA-binding protein
MAGANVGPLTFANVDASAQTTRRTPRLAGNTQGDCYALTLALDGSILVVQDGRQAVLRRDDYVIFDCSRPLAFIANGNFRVLSCLMPRDMLCLAPEQIARVTGTAISGRGGVGWVLAPFLRRLCDQARRGRMTGDVHRVVEGTLDLVASLCESQLGDNLRHTPSRTELLLRIRAYIDANLGDPGLSPGQIAGAHYISRSYLYKLFAKQGTSVARLIRERRLERCRRQLGDPACVHEPVSSIGARCGLPDAAHLSRLFRDVYGCSPSDYRREQSWSR